MKVKHYALAVKKPDIKKFYEDILGFEGVREFKVNGSDAARIFGLLGSVEVKMMQHEGIDFEMFVTGCTQFVTYAHICLETGRAGDIFRKATEAGYPCFERNSNGSNTYFIRDHSQNLFELKEG